MKTNSFEVRIIAFAGEGNDRKCISEYVEFTPEIAEKLFPELKKKMEKVLETKLEAIRLCQHND